MKWEIQISLPGVQYSRVQVQLDTGSDQEVRDALLYLDRVGEIFKQIQEERITGVKPAAPTSEVSAVIEEENKQLKWEQEVHQSILNLLKNKDPELYAEIMKEVNAESDFDKRNNDAVDDALLEKDS